MTGPATGVPPARTPLDAAHRLLVAVAVLLVAGFMTVLPALGARAATGEAMESYQATYELQTDGSVKVTENIRWRFPAGDQRHGILRNIVVRMGYQDRTDVYRYYEMTDVSVSSPSGAPDSFRVSDYGATKQIRIGSADLWTSGTQEYVVRYTLGHVLNPIAENETVEFHYNVFGAAEQTTRERVQVSVQAPAPAEQVACYEGEQGSDRSCDSAQAGTVSTFTASDLTPGEGLTVISDYPQAAFGTVTPDLRQGSSDANAGTAASPAVNRAATIAGLAAPLLAAGGMGALVWTRGRDERFAGLTPGLTPSSVDAEGHAVVRGGRPTVAVQFTPPEGVTPGLVGVVVDETANPIDVSATVLDLAVRGFLQIEEIQGGRGGRTDWRLTLLDPQADSRLLPYERQLLDGIFHGRRGSVDLSDLKNHFSTTLARVQSAMYRETVERNWFRSSPQMQRKVWQSLGAMLAVLGGVLLIWGRPALQTVLGGGLTGATVLGGGLLAAGGIVYLLGSRMAAKTAWGSAVHQQALGFKEYLLTAEADQIRWEEASNIFSRYLPYAVVFGVAERWARVFADVARAAEAAGHVVVMPTWYIGYGGYMDFGGIASGADAFGTTSTGTFTSTPGSSGSSGFSVGGGFSGSGGGGSSSGSW